MVKCRRAFCMNTDLPTPVPARQQACVERAINSFRQLKRFELPGTGEHGGLIQPIGQTNSFKFKVGEFYTKARRCGADDDDLLAGARRLVLCYWRLWQRFANADSGARPPADMTTSPSTMANLVTYITNYDIPFDNQVRALFLCHLIDQECAFENTYLLKDKAEFVRRANIAIQSRPRVSANGTVCFNSKNI